MAKIILVEEQNAMRLRNKGKKEADYQALKLRIKNERKGETAGANAGKRKSPQPNGAPVTIRLLTWKPSPPQQEVGKHQR
jgi:hypothetical protein